MKKDIWVKCDQEAISLITNITYKMEDYWYGETQQPLKMSMLLPKHKERHQERLPLIVWFCGGNFEVVDKDIWLPQLVTLARNGFIVASVQYRTSNDAPLPAGLIDAKAAIRYLRAHASQYLIDTDHIFVMGESAGASIACLAGLIREDRQYDQGDFLDQSSRVSAVVDFYGSVNMEKRLQSYKDDSLKYAAFMHRFDGTEEEKIQSIRRFSAVEYVTKEAVPFLIFHGTNDDQVAISQSDELYDRLTQCNVPCEYYRLQGCVHGADEFYQPEIMDIVLKFLKDKSQ